ncbi:MAG TPA: MFS transporter [Marmoricola sp.]|nr:MFS transporter [Marmoricola sp.]
MNGAAAQRAGRPTDALTYALFTVALGTNIPTPLLIVYGDRLDLGESDLTAIFGCYALGLIAALVVAGSASDRYGRRGLVLAFSVISGLASLVFIPAVDSVPLLYVGRVLQGVVSGVVFSVANAWLQDLAGPSRARAAATRGAVSSSLGFAVAPVVSGLLASYAPWPTTLPYLVHVAVLLSGLVVLVGVPETVHEPRIGPLLQLGLPRQARRAFWTVLAPTAVGVYAFPSVAITLLPLLIDPDQISVAYIGLLGGLTLACSAIAAAPARHFGPVAAPAGVALGAVGYGFGAAAVHWQSSLLLLPAAVLLGAGAGLCLAAGLTLTARLAPPSFRGAMNSAFYVFAYLGFAAPLLLARLGVVLGDTWPVVGIGAVFAGIAVWLLADLRLTGVVDDE